MAIRIVVTTWPPASLLTMPKIPIGAIGCTITIPMMIKSRKLSTRFSCEDEGAVGCPVLLANFCANGFTVRHRLPTDLFRQRKSSAVRCSTR